jgi:hypothetical protein
MVVDLSLSLQDR